MSSTVVYVAVYSFNIRNIRVSYFRLNKLFIKSISETRQQIEPHFRDAQLLLCKCSPALLQTNEQTSEAVTHS